MMAFRNFSIAILASVREPCFVMGIETVGLPCVEREPQEVGNGAVI